MNIWTTIIWIIAIIAGIKVLMSWINKTDEWVTNFFIACCSAFCLTFISDYFKQTKIILCIMFVCIVLCWILIWCRAIKGRNRKRIIRRRIYNSFTGARRIVAIMMAVLAFSMVPDIWKKDDVQEVVSYGDEYKFDENIETMLKLQEEEWNLLTVAEKLEVMQCVAYCEARYLGLWTPITVKVEHIGRKGVLGYYTDAEYAIYLDDGHISEDMAEDVLISLCHEMYHAYSHRMVDVYNYSRDEMKKLRFFSTASQYAENLANYITPEKDDVGYRTQKFEADAFSYGEYAASEYYRMIDEYLEEQNGNEE